mmetsp:Transcript_85453/g.217851  ORF Transcript_85453/g.217851 Transcript_85453/m.217851 type:complete len:220 (-) Transcript_85453:380-1039(-)
MNPDEVCLVGVRDDGVGIQVVDVLVRRPALLVECEWLGGLKEHHHVVEHGPQKGGAEADILLEVLLWRENGDVVVLREQSLDLRFFSKTVHMDSGPTDADNAFLGSLSKLTNQRQPSEVFAIAGCFVVELPATALTSNQLNRQRQSHHENCVVDANLEGALQVIHHRHLVLEHQLSHLRGLDRQDRHHEVSILLLVFVLAVGYELPVLPLVVLDSQLGA